MKPGRRPEYPKAAVPDLAPGETVLARLPQGRSYRLAPALDTRESRDSEHTGPGRRSLRSR